MKLKLYPSTNAEASGEVFLSEKTLRTNNLKEGSYVTLKSSDGKVNRLKVRKSENESNYVNKENYRFLKKEAPYTATIGCDPEFIFLDKDDKLVNAEDFLPYLGELGSDGELGELRPLYGMHENEVTERIRRLISRIPETLPNKDIRPEAHSEKSGLLIGFHLHVGIPDYLTKVASKEQRAAITNAGYVFDYFVGIPSLLLEDNPRRRFSDTEFGKASDWRLSSSTFEYRTPGGFNLRHPDYARGILALGILVAKNVFSKIHELSHGGLELKEVENFEVFRDIYNVPSSQKIEEPFSLKSKESSFNLLSDIVSSLASMQHFEDHSEAVTRYFEMILDNTQFSPNILEHW